MKLYIPVTLKMAYNPFKPIEISQENPQIKENNDSAFDKVIDPLTEFNVSPEKHDKSPDDSYNLPEHFQRKASSTSLYTRLDYFIDRNELPRVHRTLSNQSLASERVSSNILTDSIDLGSINDIQLISNNNNADDLTVHSQLSIVPVVDLPVGNVCIISPEKYETGDNVCINSPDKYETGSNVSVNSNLTDIQGSILSSISDIDENTYKNNILEYENLIKDLKSRLQNKEIENDQFKFALKDLDWKTELKWQEKYQDLLRQKANCEGQLRTVQSQYDNLLKEKNTSHISNKINDKNNIYEEYTKLQLKINNLEKINSEMNSKLILSNNETKQWHAENKKLEIENENLRINLQEIKIDLDSKNSVLQGLKNKITEQHIELQNQIQAKLKLNNFVATLNNEIESIKKSEKWYIEQLHSCQYAKNKIQQELMSTQSTLIASAQKIDKLKSEVINSQNITEETKIKAMKEKEKLLRRMEIVEADLMERQMLNTEIKSEIKTIQKEELQDSESKIIIEECQEKINNLNKIIKEKDDLIKQLNKQSSEFLVRVTTLQKILNEKELQYQTLLELNSNLEMKCNNYNENIRTKDSEILDLRNKIVNLEVSLHAANIEKHEIDDAIKTIREDFNKFMKCYNNMKNKLEEKTKIINNFESEKQELFMENNWRVCEIEELQQKILNNKVTEAEFLEIKTLYDNTLIEKQNLAKENIILKEKLNETNNELQNEDISKLKESLNTREEQLLNQTQNCELLNNEIIEKDTEINNLKYELEHLVLRLNNSNFKTTELKDLNISLELKISELHKKIKDCNYVIDQFNELCKSSELEKHDLASKLEFLKMGQEKSTTTDNDSQTDISNIDDINFDGIKSKLSNLLDGNNVNFDDLNIDNFFIRINEFLDVLQEIRHNESNKLETNNKVIKTLKNRLNVLKKSVQERILHMEQRCRFAFHNLEDMNNKLIVIHNFLNYKKAAISVGTQTILEEITNKEVQNTNMAETTELAKNKNKYDKGYRTLLRKLKEELKSRKTAENSLETLQETYNLALAEINNLKLENNRTIIEIETLKTRCQEYKEICDKQNEKILLLEKEKGASELRENMECTRCLELKKMKGDYSELEYQFTTLQNKLTWYEKEIYDKEKGITECKKQLFNEKIQSSALRKQVSSIQMCLDNANSLLDTKLTEHNQLKAVCDKLEKSKVELSEMLENEQAKYQDVKYKLDENLRLLEERTAKDELLADEIKTISCHLHQKNLELSNAENRMTIVEEEHTKKLNALENTISELQNNLSEVQLELEGVRNDKFFLQRLCADLKMSLQGTRNQNKERLDTLQMETNNLNNKLDSLPSTNIDDEYISKLLKESTVTPDKPLLNLRSCLDSLKKEMAILQKEIIAKTQNNA